MNTYVWIFRIRVVFGCVKD